MSVMACDRNGCENIMCKRCILNNRKYICEACFKELVAWRQTWPEQVKDVEGKIREFFDTPVGSCLTLSGQELENEFRRLVGND